MMKYIFILLLVSGCVACKAIQTVTDKEDIVYYAYYKEDSQSEKGYIYASLQISDGYFVKYMATGAPYSGYADTIEINGFRQSDWKISFTPVSVSLGHYKNIPASKLFGKEKVEIEYNSVENKDRILLSRTLARDLFEGSNLAYDYNIHDFPSYMIPVKSLDLEVVRKAFKNFRLTPEISSVTCDPVIPGNDLKTEKLSGQVKAIKQISYNVEDVKYNHLTKERKIIKGDRTNFSDDETMEFNPCGYYTYQCTFTSNNGKDQKEENFYEYNTSNQLTKKISYDYDWGWEKIVRYTYNAQNKMEENRRLENGGSRYREKFNYDSAGFLVSSDEYSDDSKDPIRTIYTNDKKGNCIEKVILSHDGVPFIRDVKAYDDEGNEILSEFYTIPDNETTLSLYSKTVKAYERNKLIIDSYMHWDPKTPPTQSRYICLYNTHGDPISKEWRRTWDDSLQSSVTFEYTYDSHGNWIERLEYSGEDEEDDEKEKKELKPSQITIREISYYQ